MAANGDGGGGGVVVTRENGYPNGQGKGKFEVEGDWGYTQDGTVDLKGRPVLQSETGRWRACWFFVGYEVFERMAYYGISSNLVEFLRRKMSEGTVSSANNVTNWVGTVWMTPVLGAYIADAHLGRYWTFVGSSVIYLVGMLMLTTVVSVPGLTPPHCDTQHNEQGCRKPSSFQAGIFYFALYVIALGTGGTKPNISTMGADQFDDFEPVERTLKFSFFNWWMFSIFFGTLFSNTFLVYVQEKVGWKLGYGLPTLGLAISISVFLSGTKYYRHKVTIGSPCTRVAQVLVAAVRKWKATIPIDPKELYEPKLEEYAISKTFRIDHSNSLRFLDKAAVKNGCSSPWSLCTVTQVEETKQMMKMLPILAATFIPSMILAQTNTLFIKQGTTLDRQMGRHFKIPPACLTAFVTIFMLLSLVIYDRWFVSAIRRYTKNPRGITLLQRMGIGIFFQMIVMVVAYLAERKRLSVIHEKNITDQSKTVPLTIYILFPQFALAGIADTFVEVAKLEFFYDQAPERMKSLGTSYFTSSLGIGNFLSSFLLKAVSSITKRQRRKGWILDNLNASRLDYYYALLAILMFFNLLFYLYVSKSFVYNADPTSTPKPENGDLSKSFIHNADPTSTPKPENGDLSKSFIHNADPTSTPKSKNDDLHEPC
ncbi:hypothetical protein MLD38_030067 [Melastoma candidum]|uniref:Uncharacterized protein n=1 Tax=Melastoma candidum TaxID=119954 RepID=A0ACB9MKP6_9MYRT|nr:hypothetical protein MLD38_030067 [Melastoma candidum]